MGDNSGFFDGGSSVLHGNAIRTPLPDRETELRFHENMVEIAEGRRQKADLLEDPSVPVSVAYETELEHVANVFERRLRAIAGDDYEEIARAYAHGERQDRVGALATYHLEALWRIQQLETISDMLYFPLVLRYPDSFTINLRFAATHTTTESISIESPEYAGIDDDDEPTRRYLNDSQHEQEQAAEYLRKTAALFREQFPHPDEVPFEERKYGGLVGAIGRHESEFTEMLATVTPDPDRFSEPVTESVLVPAGKEAKLTEEKYLPSPCTII